MRITTYSDYALRLLMYLGLSEGRLCTIAEVASSYDISRGHIMKVANELSRAGFIEAIRGRNGGMRLAKPAEVIRVGEVLRLTETDFDLVPCFESAKLCVITPDCTLKTALGQATQAFLETLDRYTLKDLLVSGEGLRRALSIDPISGP